MKCGGEVEVSIEIPEQTPRLVLIGGGRVAAAVGKMAEEIGFDLAVIDPFADNYDFPDHAQVIPKSVEEGMHEIEITPQSYIVIATRHKYDEPALREALKTDAAYIGLMGSKSRVRSIFETLEEEGGVEKEDLSRVFAPIGLDIGAETPEEIAISILGEIIKERRSPESNGNSLKIDY